ncbi:MAG: DUF6265 family protein [Candidatus Acidiferrales bacterium]
MKRIGFSGLRWGAIALLCLFIRAPLAHSQQVTGTGADPGARNGNASAPSAAAKSASIPTTETSSATQQANAATAQHPTLDQFSWLEGQWLGEWGARVTEQTWLEPKAGEMAGLFRLIEGRKPLVLELFSIVEKPDGIEFFLRHLTPELLPWEKSDATMLKLESVDATKATFVNPVNGEPKRLIFTRVDADTYTQRSEIEPAEGEPQVVEITFHRQKPPAAAANAGSAAHRKKP